MDCRHQIELRLHTFSLLCDQIYSSKLDNYSECLLHYFHADAHDFVVMLFWSYLLCLQVYIGGCFFMGLSSIVLLLEKSPLLYHAYVFMTIFLWTRIVQNFEFLKAVWRELSIMPFKYILNLLTSSVVALVVLEFLVCNNLLTHQTFLRFLEIWRGIWYLWPGYELLW